MRRRTRTGGRWLMVALLLSAPLAAQQDDQGGEGGGEGGGPPPPTVAVIEVARSDVPVTYRYSGRVVALRDVEVRARVGGILLERAYDEGEEVAAGDTLFRIDPEMFRAEVESARATVASAEAALAQSRRTEQRNATLRRQGSASQATLDEAVSARELAEAELRSAEASLRAAELSLEWTEVTAPIGGMTGLNDVPRGSLVAEGDLLTTIVQLDPAHVQFAVADTEAFELRRLREEAGLDRASIDSRISVEVDLAGANREPRRGDVDFTSATIDTATGTRLARAVIDNRDGRLVPGQFVRVRLYGLSVADAIRLPATALSQGPEGTFVYTVDEGGIARARPVEIDRESADAFLVLSGLEDGMRVVTEGLVRVRPDAPVTVRAPAGAVDPVAADAGASAAALEEAPR